MILVCLNLSGIFDIQAQEQSVRPGINTYYMDPDWQQWVSQFETPGREIYDRCYDILRASTGFILIDGKPLLRTNYYLEFRKVE